MEKKKRFCFECGNKSLVLTDQLGKGFKYKDFKMVPLQESFELYECECCGNISLNSTQNKELDDVIVASVKTLTRKYLDIIIEKTGLTQKELSRELSISEQYLSYIKKGSRVVSAMTFNYLKLIAECPTSTTVLGISVNKRLRMDWRDFLIKPSVSSNSLKTKNKETLFAKKYEVSNKLRSDSILEEVEVSKACDDDKFAMPMAA